MYNAEVLSKFPVIQHFPFGSLFSFARDPAAVVSDPSTHIASHSSAHSQPMGSSKAIETSARPSDGLTRAPWGTFQGTTATSSNGIHNSRSAQEPLRSLRSRLSQETQIPSRRAPRPVGHTLKTQDETQENTVRKNNPPILPSETRAPWAS